MNKVNLILVGVLALIAAAMPDAFAANTANRMQRDVRLPSQQVLEKDTWAIPIVATTNRVLTTNAGPTSAALATVTTFTAQPDYARNLTVTPTGTTGDVEACIVTIAGTDIAGGSISETFTFIADASTAQTGNKAFKTVTSATWPANCESGTFAATWIIGVGSKLGLRRCSTNAGAYAWSVFNSIYETTRGTFAATTGLGNVASNTFIPNGTMDGAKPVEVYYVQDFTCP